MIRRLRDRFSRCLPARRAGAVVLGLVRKRMTHVARVLPRNRPYSLLESLCIGGSAVTFSLALSAACCESYS